MRVCKYCGRHLTQNYLYCPGCGSQSFEEIKGTETYVVEKPPAEGYKIDTSYYDRQIEDNKGTSILGEVILTIFFILGFFAFGFEMVFEFLFFIFSGVITTVSSDRRIRKARDAIVNLHFLSRNGLLIKNLPYNIEKYYPAKDSSGKNRSATIQYKISVDYKDKEGKVHHLVSEPKREYRLHDVDGRADLLIDPNDISNYYIDVDIH